MKLWSLRSNGARGLHWAYERDVTPETQDAWLDVFQKDEPNVRFVLSARKPSEKKIAA